MSKSPQIVSRQLLSSGFAKLEKIVFRRRRRDGDTVELTREILDPGDGVAILPYDPERGTIILIRQFRGVAFLKEQTEWLVEACAGKLEGADPLERIIKETEEETGIRLTSQPRRIFSGYSSPGSFAERLSFFVAPYRAEDRVTKGGGLVKEGEDIEVLEMTLDAAIEMVERGAITDIKTFALLYYARSSGILTASAPTP